MNRVLTDNYIHRLARANAALRELRAQGCTVLRVRVQPGDALVKPELHFVGGGASARVSDDGVHATRLLGAGR